MRRAAPDPVGLAEWLAGPGPAAGLGPALAGALADTLAARPLDPPLEAPLVEALGLLVGLRADADMLAAAIIHAVPAWQGEPADALMKAFPALRPLIEGQRAAAQVWTLHAGRPAAGRAEGLRRLLLAIIRDLRVVLVLLARQLVALRHAAALPPEQREAIARLAADIHAPLANRLGIWQLKWELEDLAFRHLQPDTYKRIAKLLDEKRIDREGFIEDAKQRIREALAAAGLRGEVAGRPKHIFSIWKKMQRKGVPFSELYDIRAVRVLVDDVPACYAVLGIVHSLWTPVASEFDDYIAKPKGNHYRSLHTAIVGPGGRTLEVQIRTHEMHEHAELGVAAHWRYKEGGGADAQFERKVAWMRQLLDQPEGRAEGEGAAAGGGDEALLAGLSTELVEDRVYLLTPKGEVVDLPRGGTVLDFAYHVHTEVGHRCRGAKVNGRIVPLTHQPRSGEQVEILTAKVGEPSRDWLHAANGFLHSARSRDKVRAWFHRLDRARNLQAGRELLERELKRVALHQADLAPVLAKFKLPTLEELHIAVALGDVGPHQVARALHEHAQAQARPAAALGERIEARAQAVKPGRGFTVEGVGNLMHQLARCCQPVPGDAIAGYLTRGRGVSIHREGCPALQRLAAATPDRVLPVEWGREGGGSYRVEVELRALDRKTLLKDLTNVIAQGGAHVLSVDHRVDASAGTARLVLGLKVADFGQLGQLLAKLAAVPGVSEARRLG